MADRKISELTLLQASGVASDDLFLVVDVNEPDINQRSKRFTASGLASYVFSRLAEEGSDERFYVDEDNSTQRGFFGTLGVNTISGNTTSSGTRIDIASGVSVYIANFQNQNLIAQSVNEPTDSGTILWYRPSISGLSGRVYYRYINPTGLSPGGIEWVEASPFEASIIQIGTQQVISGEFNRARIPPASTSSSGYGGIRLTDAVNHYLNASGVFTAIPIASSGLSGTVPAISGVQEGFPLVKQNNTIVFAQISGAAVNADFSSQQIRASRGTATTPSYTFTGDLNTGIFSPSEDVVALTASGLAYLEIRSSGTFASGLYYEAPTGTNYFRIATEQDIGTGSGQIPLNSYLGSMAYQDYEYITVEIGSFQSVVTSSGFVANVGTVSLPSYSFSGNVNTGIYLPTAGQMSFVVSGTSIADVRTSGFFVSGYIYEAPTGTNYFRVVTQQDIGYEENQVPLNQFLGNLAFENFYYPIYDNNNDLAFNRTDTTTTSGSRVGRVYWSASDGTSLVPSASIDVITDATPGTNSMPSRLVFSTTPSGSASSLERLNIDSDGKVLIGTSSPRNTFFNGTTIVPLVQLEAASTSNAAPGRFVSQTLGINTDRGPVYVFAKHRSTSINGSGIVQANDVLGYLSFQGSDGSEFVEAASITSSVDAPPFANDVAGRLVFSTTTSGTSAPTEKMRLTHFGNLKIGSTSSRSSIDGTSQIVLFNGTAPSGTLANGVSLYSSAGQLTAMDATGSGVTLAPYIRTPLSTASITALGPNGGTNTGIFYPDISQVAVSTSGTERLRVDSSGRIGINTAPTILAGQVLVGGQVVGSPGGISRIFTIQNAIGPTSSTLELTGYYSGMSTQDGTGEVSTVSHFRAQQGTLTGGGRTAPNTQIGFHVTAGLDGAINNYGFYSDVSAATGRWNFYAAGTAANYFAGPTQTSLASAAAPSLTPIGGTNTGIFYPDTSTVAVSTGGVERWRTTSTGQLRLAGAGITFNGDTAAANELDDYEEGTWTPAFSFATPGDLSVSYTSQVGYYRIIGKLCVATFVLEFTPTYTTSAGVARVTGLPLSTGTYLTTPGSVDRFSGFTLVAGYDNLWLRKNTSQNYVEIYSMGRSGSPTITTSEVLSGSAKILNGTIIYNL